jgi:creatinine amidohydrolase/Fe(II)-dependent formamide hydrolase-like protein
MILEDTAKSLYAHGFTDVYILGDSGDSVDAQVNAALKISEDLESGQTVLHVTDYYKNHGQVDWLKSKGYTQDSIGYHAGIRDTSELLAVEPEGVRLKGLRQTSQDKGANGAYWKASPEIGEKMLDLKIDAAVKQIKAFHAPKMASNVDSAVP